MKNTVFVIFKTLQTKENGQCGKSIEGNLSKTSQIWHVLWTFTCAQLTCSL